VIPYLPNNPQRWEEAVNAVIQIMDTWRKDAEPDKRMREWIDRVEWDRLFKKTGIKVSLKDLDGYIYGTEFTGLDLRFVW
jgi:sulfite reductase beta subunit